VTLHKAALRPPAATTAEPRKVGARKRVALRADAFKAPRTVAKHCASSTVAKCRTPRAVAKCCAAGAVTTDREVSAAAKSRAVSAVAACHAVTNLGPARTTNLDQPSDLAGVRRIRGATAAHPVRHSVRDGEAPATPRRRRRRAASTSDSTGVWPPASKETRVNVGATRAGNLFARLQLHLATARFLAELRADPLWQTACDNAALELDSLASGMAPEELAAPLHPRVLPGQRGDGERMSCTPAHALRCTLEGGLRRGSGTGRVSAPAASAIPVVTARHFPAAVTASGGGALATSDSGASTVSEATFNACQETPALAVPNVIASTMRHPPRLPPHRTARQPFSRQPFSQEKGAR
jgi:hypothetical protein